MNIDKTKSTPVGEIRKIFTKAISVDPSNQYLIHAVVSSGIIDRYNEIVTPEAFAQAIKATDFVNNNVVLASHRHAYDTAEPPVIGNVLTETYRLEGVDSIVDILFDDDELGQKYARKYRKKVMRAFSIGFRGLEGKYENQDNVQIWLWTKIELLEISAVAIPACPSALSKIKGLPDDEVRDAINELVNEQFAELKNYFDEKFKDIQVIIIANSGGLAEREHGNGFELPEPGGENKNLTVQILKDCQEILSKQRST